MRSKSEFVLPLEHEQLASSKFKFLIIAYKHKEGMTLVSTWYWNIELSNSPKLLSYHTEIIKMIKKINLVPANESEVGNAIV